MKGFLYNSTIHKLTEPYILEYDCIVIFQTKGSWVHALSTYAKMNWLYNIYIAYIQNEMNNPNIYGPVWVEAVNIGL